jgi:hypothetical protein
VMGWENGQASLIHDHGRSSSWVKVIQGSLEEERFESLSSNEADESCSLLLGSCSSTEEGVVHRLSNKSGERAVSLHIYSPPLDVCKTKLGDSIGDIDVGNLSCAHSE